MSSYKKMYLVSEEEYRRIESKSSGGGSKIGGPVTAGSSVNNIEVGHGGSVVIDRHGHAVDCKKLPAALQPVASRASNGGGSNLAAYAEPKTRRLLEKRFPQAGRSRQRVPAAKSTKLSGSKKEPNALAPNKAESDGRDTNANLQQGEEEEPMEVDWEGGREPAKTVPTKQKQTARQLEKAIAKKHSQRTQKEKEKILLDTLKVARVKELQGERGVKERMNETEQERQIVHELRDIYRDEVKKDASRARLGPRLVPNDDDVRMQEPAKKRRAATGSSGPASKRVGSGRSLTPSAALAAGVEEPVRKGVKRAIGWGDEVPDEYGKVKLAKHSSSSERKPLPPPTRTQYSKRSREELEDSDEDDVLQRPPTAKRARRDFAESLIPHSVKRKSVDTWPESTRKRSKVMRPWMIREKRPARSSWSASARKRRKANGEDDEEDSDDTSDDGNGGDYKKFLDDLYQEMNVE